MISPESDDAPIDPDGDDFELENSDGSPSGKDKEGEQEANFEQQRPADSPAGAYDELAEARQRALRLQAELENYRKRTQRIMDEERKYCGLPLMRDLLEVVDNLERATSAADQDAANAGLLEGVKIVANQFKAVLRKHHCLPIEAEGQPFDPHFHQAIAHFPNEQYEPGTVSNVHQVGYRLHDRVVRPTQVIVAAPAATTESSDDSESDQDSDEATES